MIVIRFNDLSVRFGIDPVDLVALSVEIFLVTIGHHSPGLFLLR